MRTPPGASTSRPRPAAGRSDSAAGCDLVEAEAQGVGDGRGGQEVRHGGLVDEGETDADPFLPAAKVDLEAGDSPSA